MSSLEEKTITESTDQNEDAHEEKDAPIEPAQVSCAAHENGHVDRHDRKREQCHADIHDIVRESDQEVGGANFLEPAQWNIQNFAHQIIAELGHGALRKSREHDLRNVTGEDLPQEQDNEPGDGHGGKRAGTV